MADGITKDLIMDIFTVYGIISLTSEVEKHGNLVAWLLLVPAAIFFCGAWLRLLQDGVRLIMAFWQRVCI
jgi:hypothetical protein